MLSAFDRDRKIVLSTEVASADGPFTCPDRACQAPLLLKKGNWNIHHFAHLPNTAPCSRSNGESQEHESLKLQIYSDAKKEEGLLEVHIEHPVGPKRIADVALIGPTRKIAVEVQISPISEEDILCRMHDHREAGYSTLWLVNPEPEVEDLQKNIMEKTKLMFKCRAFHRDIERAGHGALMIYQGDLNVRAYHLMGKQKIWKHYKHGEMYKICDLDDADTIVRGGFKYRIVTVPQAKRWWEKLSAW